MPEHVVQALVALGFSLNESRAYSALLSLGPSTGYEVSQRAGIPRSAVYGALRKLVAGGAARSVSGSPERFVATPAESIVDLLRQRFDRSTQDFMESICRLNVEDSSPDAFCIRGYARVMEEASRLVRGAQSKVVISGWPREFELLRESADVAAHTQRAKLYLFSHATPPSMAGIHFSYGLSEEAIEHFWLHRLFLVVDDETALIGSTEMAPTDNAIISQSPAIVELVTSQISLDITLLGQRYGETFGALLYQILGKRIGAMGPLLEEGPVPRLGEEVLPSPKRGHSNGTTPQKMSSMPVRT